MIGKSTKKLFAIELAKRAGFDSYNLVTRTRGEQFLPILLSVLADYPDELVKLDFSDVSLMTASFADAVFGALASQRASRQAPNTCLILEAVDVHLEEIAFALISRPEREKKLRNCIVPVRLHSGEITLVGKAEGHVTQTFAALRTHKQLTARTLADNFGLEIGAASTRLKVLYDLGLAQREEIRDTIGKQYTYVWPF